MFVRKKTNRSGLISVQVIDKSHGKYRVVRTIGLGKTAEEAEDLVEEGKRFIKARLGALELDFMDYGKVYREVLGSIQSHKMVGVSKVLGKIFDEIGFNEVPSPLFRDLVLYRLVYPRSKLKTTEYLYRYEQKVYSEDDIYRYMDKLHSSQQELVEQISYRHTLGVLEGGIQAVFYDVTTLYFEVEQEDELRKTGFSKDGKAQHPQIVLGLLVSRDAYPLAYQIFEGNTFEGKTFLPVLEGFSKKYAFEKLTVIADAGLLSASNIELLVQHGYDFIIGARIKNETQFIKEQILQLNMEDGQSEVLPKAGMSLIVTYSESRAKKDRYNREKGIRMLEKRIKSGKLTKAGINNRGYNKFLKMDGEVALAIDQAKIQQDQCWDGLKGYLTNSTLTKQEILDNYAHLWQIEKAFRVAKSELRIRPVFHRKRKRIEAHICLNFAAYKLYKELERQLREKKSPFSPERVIEIIQSIYQISLITPNNEIIQQTLILSEEQRYIQLLFDF
jgi:transposase